MLADKRDNLRVLLAAAECAPFAKVGGLADVVGSLPGALCRAGIDARVIMPLYGSISRDKYDLKRIYSGLSVPSGRLMLKANVYEGALPGSKAKAYFIDCPEYFGMNHIYGQGDNSERFLFFSLAALYAIPALGFYPAIVHMHDAHVAMMADIIKVSNLEYVRGLKSVYTIHNFYYQYKENERALTTANLHPGSLKSLSVDLEDGDVNFMAQGILNSDIVTTVSPTYAKEILTSAYGAGLEKIIRKRQSDLYGILNGIDTELFNPETDGNIARNYGIRTIRYKKENKVALQRKFGLPAGENIPLIGLVSRLVWQKGLEIITGKLAALKAQFVFLGRGTANYEDHLSGLAKKYPDRFAAHIGFDLKAAQMVYAGSDFFLMPSRFEPCGLGQMIAMRYGAVPIVRATGGLKDTVTPALGFRFRHVEEQELFRAVKAALDLYYEKPEEFGKMQARGMEQDFSWDRPAAKYVALYRRLAGTAG